MCINCGYFPCSCTQPVVVPCDPCVKQTGCRVKLDAQCVIYHWMDPTALNKLTCLNLPNGTTLEAFMEAVDAALCEGLPTTITVEDTNSIDLGGDGSGGDPLTADLRISPDAGNIIEVRANGVFAEANDTGIEDLCAEIDNVFVTDSAQKNAIAQTAYDFLIHGSAGGCEMVSPPTGFAVTGSTRVSAYGAMEWFATLADANTAAVSGETVLLYNDATATNLVAKSGVNYYGVGKKRIGNLTASAGTVGFYNIIVTGTTAISGTAKCEAVNTDILGTANFTGSSTWTGGRFLDNTTTIAIQGSAQVSKISSDKRISLVQAGRLTEFDINYTGADIQSALSVNVSGTFKAHIAHGNIYAPNLLTGSPGALYCLVLQTDGELVLSDITVSTVEPHGTYLQCGDQDDSATLIASNITSRSTNKDGIRLAGSQIPTDTANLTRCVVSHLSGYSENGNGITTINGNLRHCSGYSVSGAGILVGGAENQSSNLNIIDCTGESLGDYALRCERDVYIIGGTYICRFDDAAGNPIRLTPSVATLDPDGDLGYCIVGVKTIAANTTAYAISGVAGAVVRISGCEFLNYSLLTNVPGIDPVITIRAVAIDAYGNAR